MRQQYVTPEQIEDDKKFESILAAAGHGVPSGPSELGSHAIAAMINWWNGCEQPPQYDWLTDVDDLITILQEFKKQAKADPTLMYIGQLRTIPPVSHAEELRDRQSERNG